VNVTRESDNNGVGVINDRPPNTPRNSLPGSGLIDLDVNPSHGFALSKVKEHAKILTVSANSFNVLNHVNNTTYTRPISESLLRRFSDTPIPPSRPRECNLTSNSNSEVAAVYPPITVAALPPAR
jgi:hypothetical protein